MWNLGWTGVDESPVRIGKTEWNDAAVASAISRSSTQVAVGSLTRQSSLPAARSVCTFGIVEDVASGGTVA
jgi:hypothetical protein